MKRVNTYESGGDSDDEFIDSSLSPRDYEYEHVTNRKKRRGVIEKRRRDRINHCLMELRRLVPQAISKEGSTKLEKAEILQMTVDHLRSLQQINKDSNNPCQSWPIFDAHASGFRECIDEISRYLISVEGFDVQHPLRLRLLSHLECFTERSISPSSHQSWPILHQQAPSAFATPPLSSYSSSTIGYHHQTNLNFNMHHYQRPPIESSCQLPPPPPLPSSSSCI
ncbi:unnamed protein product [Rotaria sp. Silwood1]|nr:unnamed protein product [Rotaria sp. Silwood1]CAF0740076.1 unnamed protein product [Rotaria sp. Silwood1]CAF3353766.1 unnamed protein product [Rotaria sp. Silwood1]CAF3354560.1 unnamed protein product [Rotaria sp. Silwood1]CAF4508170.1 unnamed protein product [Rotaria sp. Silwood1]